MIYKVILLCILCHRIWKQGAYVGSEAEILMATIIGWGMQEQGWKKGPWTPEEDKLLSEYVSLHGEGRWSSVARSAGIHIYYYCYVWG